MTMDMKAKAGGEPGEGREKTVLGVMARPL